MGHSPDRLVSKYPRRMRAVLIAVIGTLALAAYLFPDVAGSQGGSASTFDQLVESFDIPPTAQFTTPPPPSRPLIPVASEDEDLAEDITIEETGLEDFAWEAPPPPPDEGPRIKFVPYEVPPIPIGGMQALLRNVHYPEAAREAGIEGRVVVQAYISEKGVVLETFILSGMPSTGLDEAAVKAIRRTRFKPALQRDKPVAVWIAFPINFILKN